MPKQSWNTRVGLNNVGSYQVSGKPYATGSCVAPAAGDATLKVEFPKVTKWVQVIPRSSELGDIKVGFSKSGSLGTNFFQVNVSSSSAHRLDLKVSELHFVAAGAQAITFDIVAGLTNIDASSTELPNGTNWSGSSGVG